MKKLNRLFLQKLLERKYILAIITAILLTPLAFLGPQANAENSFSLSTASRDIWHFFSQAKSEKEGIWDRIREDLDLSLPQKPTIQSYIDDYLKNSFYLERNIERAEPYLEHIVNVLDEQALPRSFVLIPLIESAYNPRAVSQDGAAGLWQLMPGTAKQYGIRYDARRDFVASTGAATRYLSYLWELFEGDELLVLAAYNAGEGYTLRAIERNRKAGLSTDFWSLSMPRETQNYVRRFVALSYILGQPNRYPIQWAGETEDPLLSYLNDQQRELPRNRSI